MDLKIKKSSRYVLLPGALQDMAWIYYISLLMKHLITFCWKTWGDWYQDKKMITTTKNISGNIVYMIKPVKKYWKKKHLKRCKLHRTQKIKLPEASDKKECNKVKSTKQNTNYVYLLSSVQISKVFCLNKTPVDYRHQNPSSTNTSITYHVEAASTWNTVMGNTLNHT